MTDALFDAAQAAARLPETMNALARRTRPKVIGLDLSLTSTGVAGWGWCDRIQPGNTRGAARLEVIRAAVVDYTVSADLVVVEGPSYGSRGGHEHERGGLWWLVAWQLARLDIPMAVAPPNNLKLYATGRGGADKDAVTLAAARRYPDIPITGNDEADAWILCAMGLDHLGHPYTAVPAGQRKALLKVAWP